jgi:hypothetical protein
VRVRGVRARARVDEDLIYPYPDYNSRSISVSLCFGIERIVSPYYAIH